MNKIMKMWLCTMLLFVLSSSLAMAAELEETQEEKKKTEAVTGYSSLDDKEIRELIGQMTEAESQQDWNRYPDFWCSYNKEEWKELFASDTFLSDCRGVATVRSADIVVLEEISEDNILPFFKTDENYAWCTEWKAYFAGIDYTVADVNGYFHNGVNYFVFALGKENGTWKVIGKSEAPVELLESVYSTNYILEASQEDPVAIEFRIRHARQHGLVMDSDGRIYQNLTANENAVREFESCQNRRGIIRDCEHVEYATIRVQGYSAP